MAKNLENYKDAVQGYRDFLNDLEGLISQSGIKLAVLAERIEMPIATFYRKRKKKAFTVNEAEKLLEVVSGSDL